MYRWTTARQELFLFLVALLQNFYFKPPEGQESIVVHEVWGETVAPSAYQVRMISKRWLLHIRTKIFCTNLKLYCCRAMFDDLCSNSTVLSCSDFEWSLWLVGDKLRTSRWQKRLNLVAQLLDLSLWGYDKQTFWCDHVHPLHWSMDAA